MHKIYIYIGYGPILLNLLAVQWMTTQSPSWCLGAVGFNVGVNVHQNFNITDGCYLTPFIYTAIADVALIIFTYISYKLARYYRFDDVEEDLDESMTYDEDHDHHNPRSATINTRRTMGSRTTTSISTRGYTSSSNKTTRGGGNKKASISLVEPAHWKSNKNKPRRTGKTAPSPAYVVEKSPTYIPHQPINNIDTNRKPTYEKNYS